MEDTIRLLINSNLPWSVAVTIIAIVLRPALIRLVDGIIDTRQAQVKALEERNENEKEQTRVLAGVKEELNDSRTLTRSMLELLTPISKIPDRMEAIGKTMTERAEKRDDLVRDQGREQSQRIARLQDIVAGLPDAYLSKTAAHFDPKLASIQEAIEQLREQIASKPDVLTPDTVREIRAELVKIARLVTALSEPEKKEKESGG